MMTMNISIFCRSVKDRIQKAIASFFSIPVSKLYLTKPTFFSKMNTTEAKTIHDEYWHPHIDKVGVAELRHRGNTPLQKLCNVCTLHKL